MIKIWEALEKGFYTAELLKIIQAAFWIPDIFDTQVATPLSTNLNNNNDNNGPNGHLFYVGGDLMMRRGMLPIIMLPNGDCIALHLVLFWILTIWGSVHIEETVVGWRDQLQMKTSAT